MEEALQMSPRGSGAWVKTRQQLQSADTDSMIAIASQPDSPMGETFIEFEVVTVRSFLSCVPKYRRASEVEQLTTEANSRNGVNTLRGPQTKFFSNYCSGIPGLARTT